MKLKNILTVAALSTLVVVASLFAAALGTVAVRVDGGGRPLVYESTVALTTTASTTLGTPEDSNYAILTVRTAGIHFGFRPATSTAAATTADPYFAPGVYVFDNQRAILSTARVIDSSDGASVTQIVYFRKNQ